MLAVLEFIFQDFTHWVGFALLLVIIFEGIQGLFKRDRKDYKQQSEYWREAWADESKIRKQVELQLRELRGAPENETKN